MLELVLDLPQESVFVEGQIFGFSDRATILKHNVSKIVFEKCVFVNVTFFDAKFTNVTINNCTFIGCTVAKTSNIMSIPINNSTFIDMTLQA